ncbi:hypothetical protein [Paraburkholderia sp. J41]|uniref:hypothetical protein n=1 Tax=Paraburkholderia sp. J41 TaxID=2805433 RepID=UPI002AC32991|nr:hypothetical protein [Paraburkholderia sp. J41]
MQMKAFGRATTALAALALLASCAQPVEFSATGADAPALTRADDLDFAPMDQSIVQCKSAARKAGAGRCTQVRAYEACMKNKGYLTILGPENPHDCGEPTWEQDARKWLP